MVKLIFGKANAKLKGLENAIGGKVFTFSLLAGITCPYSKECKSQAVVSSDGKRAIQDGPDTVFRCFSASQEVLFTNVYKSRKANMDSIASLLGTGKLIDELFAAIPRKAKAIRWHVSGDFYSLAYFDAFLEVARKLPNIIFYAYTKSLPFWVKRIGDIPNNVILTASYGGHKDNMISQHNLRFAKVVFSELEAKELGLEIDHNDFHAFNPLTRNDSFALLIHGVQPKGSKAGKAVRALDGVGAYGRGLVGV